ncbi:tail fiber assembly protein [Cedecea davisae]|uniref:tail fiber assembly protein n=1 Tax=Cedecea davisae TaxID=158484 RepID=UPI00376F326F
MAKSELNQDMIATVAGEITVYNYDGETREYLSSSVEYLAVGVGIPGLSCIDVPGGNKDGFAICRTDDFSSWEYVTDHRGKTVFNTGTLQPIEVAILGDCPADFTPDAPTSSYDKWDGDKWVTDIAAQKKGDISEAELKRQAFLSEANRITADWRTELTLGIISSADREKLIAWMEYTKAVKAIDNSTAPEIDWPTAPSQ